MQLPKKPLVKIIYVYDNGEKYYIEGQDLKNFKKNMDKAAGNLVMRSHGSNPYLPVDWKKE